MSVPPPIVGTESYVSFEAANAIAADRLSANEWREVVAQHEAALADAAPDVAEPTSPSVPELCRRALITATATLDRMAWAGRPADRSQALAWPRADVEASAVSIPAPIATACAELAFFFLSPEGNERDGVQMVMIGPAMETRFASVSDDLPRHVRRLVEPFLAVRLKHSSALLF